MSKENPAEQHGGWQPTPQGGDYDGEATAFVHLSPEDLADIPLAAPGHGYTPPMILPLTPAAGLDPAATGNWVVRTPEQQPGQPEHSAPAADEVHWPDPNQQSGYGYPHPGAQQYQDPYAGDPAATGQWSTDATASWPAADAPLSDDSGELYTAPPVSDWYTDRPATLPGGAPAPWAVSEPAPEPPADADPGAEASADAPAESAPEPSRHDSGQPAPAADADAPAEPGAEPDGEAPDAAAPRPDTAEPGADSAAEPQDDAGPVTEPRPDTAEPGAEEFHAQASHADGPHPGTEADADPGTEAPDAPPVVIPEGPSDHPAASYVLHVNGVDRPVTDAWIGESLLYVLRERLGLAGAKDGCSQGECGACNVQVDGRLVASCLVPAATTAGSEVRTVEGLAVDGEPSDVQRALADCGAVQCGFCIPGMAMTVHDLLEGNHRPSELETRRALCGNLCRCSGYRGVLDAVNEVIAGREAAAEAAAEASVSGEPEEARIPHQAAPGAGSVQAQQQDGGMA